MSVSGIQIGIYTLQYALYGRKFGPLSLDLLNYTLPVHDLVRNYSCQVIWNLSLVRVLSSLLLLLLLV